MCICAFILSSIPVLSLVLVAPDMLDYSCNDGSFPEEGKLLDHQPLELNEDDHERVLQIPVKKVRD
jgi:hypothetical protein